MNRFFSTGMFLRPSALSKIRGAPSNSPTSSEQSVQSQLFMLLSLLTPPEKIKADFTILPENEQQKFRGGAIDANPAHHRPRRVHQSRHQARSERRAVYGGGLSTQNARNALRSDLFCELVFAVVVLSGPKKSGKTFLLEPSPPL